MVPTSFIFIHETFGKEVDLLLLSNSRNSHFVLIKDCNKHMTIKTKNHNKKNCQYCLQYFSHSKILECHVKNCFAINEYMIRKRAY